MTIPEANPSTGMPPSVVFDGAQVLGREVLMCFSDEITGGSFSIPAKEATRFRVRIETAELRLRFAKAKADSEIAASCFAPVV